MSALVLVFQSEGDAISSEKIVAKNMKIPTAAVDIDGNVIEGESGATSWASVNYRYSDPSQWWFKKPKDEYMVGIEAPYQIMVIDDSFYPPEDPGA